MSLSYTITESVSGFSRTRLSTIITIVTISISLLFLGMFTIASIHTSRFIELLRSKVELEAFLEEGLSGRETAALRRIVSEMDGVETVQIVSKEDAAVIFEKEFGENIQDILEYNPLPASLRISLAEGHKTSARAREIAAALESMKGIDGVRYRKELLELIDTRAASINNLTLGLGIIISLSAIFLVSNTIRLTIFAKRHVIRTMELVGATRGFIRLPFLLEGIIQGILGGVVASGLLYSLVEYAMRLVSVEFAGVVH
ncbi:MAG: ABC transporter permease, partial [Ignavibacteria bacterium]|nr:ABC transporter permease [Ignavibacteria bacterium]